MTADAQPDAESMTAREAAYELGRELAEAGSLDTRRMEVHEDQMVVGHVSLRLRLPSNSIHPEMMAALAERGYWLEALGEDGSVHVFVVNTDGAVHEGVY